MKTSLANIKAELEFKEEKEENKTRYVVLQY